MAAPDPATIPDDRWMEVLAPQIGTRKLKNIVIPGTHNSGTSSISYSDYTTPDAPLWIQGVGGVTPVNVVISRWAKCQGVDVGAQLMSGIRYFDLRVTPTPMGEGQLCFCHSMAGDNVGTALDQVASFISTRPGEIIILDFQHFYGMHAEHHSKLIEMLDSKLGSKMASSSHGLDVTPKDLYNDRVAQVIVAYSDESGGDAARAGNDKLWSRNATINSPSKGGGYQDLDDLKAGLQGFLGSRDNRFFVLQGVLTPDGGMVAKGLVPVTKDPSSLENLALKVNPAVMGWVADWDTQPLNIVMVDWFDQLGVVGLKGPLQVVRQAKRINMMPHYGPQPVAPITS